MKYSANELHEWGVMDKSKFYKITLIKNNLTQKDVAKVLNYTDSYVSMLISGKRYCERFDDFIENVLNKTPSKGKALKGRCPDEAWAEEFAVKKIISKDALKLFCMRTSKPVKIGRNGIKE